VPTVLSNQKAKREKGEEKFSINASLNAIGLSSGKEEGGERFSM